MRTEQVQLLWLYFTFSQDRLTCGDTEYLRGRLTGEGRASQEAAPLLYADSTPRRRERRRAALPCARACPVPGSRGGAAAPNRPVPARRGSARPRRPAEGTATGGAAARSARGRETGDLPFCPVSRSS